MKRKKLKTYKLFYFYKLLKVTYENKLKVIKINSCVKQNLLT